MIKLVVLHLIATHDKVEEEGSSDICSAVDLFYHLDRFDSGRETIGLLLGSYRSAESAKNSSKADAAFGRSCHLRQFFGRCHSRFAIRPACVHDRGWGVIIVMTGILDDMLQLPPHMKLLGQIAAGGVVIYGGLVITELNIPFGGQFVLGFVSVPITLLWVVGITNAINLIDGLDGLAAGVSAIAFSAITFMAFLHGDFCTRSWIDMYWQHPRLSRVQFLSG